jgi:hypothetical protein
MFLLVGHAGLPWTGCPRQKNSLRCLRESAVYKKASVVAAGFVWHWAVDGESESSF